MNEFKIYKGCTNPVYIQLFNDDGTERTYSSGDTVVFALSPDRKKTNAVLNQVMAYDAERNMYYLNITPVMTDGLVGDERYYYSVACVNSDGKFPVIPIQPVWVVPDLTTGGST